ncbi:MAG: FHA domain-containing protein [Chloroflexi bacterium]|nr:FHA domain-containing protein [Ktedonobacteraceae bacterium]MBV8821450.1 FHA domain-containing protein [Ktedonobacteraceae bacterium]MBV9019939.1 FHA domain-containing protein [Ktedonobacteraceae bacterium]MBV9708687.1 FHA domain-containing protein [Chloroflexota bacterium]
MPLTIDTFLLILRLLFVVLLYLFLMQVVLAVTRDLRRASAGDQTGVGKTATALGSLIVVDSGLSTTISPGETFRLEPQTSIGRGPTNTIQLVDSYISTEHAQLWYRHGKWYVKDAGSKSGTYVNEQPALAAIPAKPGDIVRVGYIKFKLTH